MTTDTTIVTILIKALIFINYPFKSIRYFLSKFTTHNKVFMFYLAINVKHEAVAHFFF